MMVTGKSSRVPHPGGDHILEAASYWEKPDHDPEDATSCRPSNPGESHVLDIDILETITS